ncbi:predicted protein [Plenodomus lingam JN3]|uniref:Predicted protein n=1 Tax=Leptosphaeria maculans (strain JN3 / isolate v23.1.3 / race Av1-4-5-6-7-8) TaxID=985895 RepID=E4ZRR1_LEPMJ|nr:predicted protein [Plenodomus lingam JN3]CBX93908.1 predicted protein [Plenodomus lingam JN3]
MDIHSFPINLGQPPERCASEAVAQSTTVSAAVRSTQGADLVAALPSAPSNPTKWAVRRSDPDDTVVIDRPAFGTNALVYFCDICSSASEWSRRLAPYLNLDNGRNHNTEGCTAAMGHNSPVKIAVRCQNVAHKPTSGERQPVTTTWIGQCLL